MIEQILLDADGVVSDFFTAACKAHRFDPSRFPPGETSIIKGLGLSDIEFWRVINATPQLWANIPPYPWTRRVFGFIPYWQLRRNVRCELVFGPTQVPDGRAQREAWAIKHAGPTFSAFRMGSDKRGLVTDEARPRTLLIDDSPNEVRRFRSAGGMALLFPNRLNGRIVHDPAEWLEDTVGKLLKGGRNLDEVQGAIIGDAGMEKAVC